MAITCLQSTAWLAKRLSLSVSTIERLRSQVPSDMPPHLIIGQHTIRYDELVVEKWIADRLCCLTNRSDTSASITAPVSPPPIRRRFGKKRITGTTAS
ncbi:MAG: hypothetical protein RLZZ298_2523 [Pseudomonadota bacterium]|jgi:predicted DNA-binding transcriptional regulator AlpA